MKRKPVTPKTAVTPPATVLVMRTCNAKMQGYGGFQTRAIARTNAVNSKR